MITPEDLLEFAYLVNLQNQPEVAVRRAISSAYYAAFHAIAQTGSELFVGSPEIRQRIARSYEHGAVRTMAAEMAKHGKQPGIDPGFLIVAGALVLLVEARQSADYDLQATLTWIDAFDSIVLATDAVRAISRLKSDPVFAELLLLPLLRDRKRRG